MPVRVFGVLWYFRELPTTMCPLTVWWFWFVTLVYEACSNRNWTFATTLLLYDTLTTVLSEVVPSPWNAPFPTFLSFLERLQECTFRDGVLVSCHITLNPLYGFKTTSFQHSFKFGKQSAPRLGPKATVNRAQQECDVWPNRKWAMHEPSLVFPQCGH